MAKRFLVDLDLNTNQLQNAVIQTASVDPSGVTGRIYFNNVSNFLKVYDGSSWQNLTTGTSGAAAVSLTGDVTGNASVVAGVITVNTTIGANSVALGTDTTGNYVASVDAGNYINITGTAGEGWAPVFAVDATTASTASKVVARDASGDVYARTFIGNLTGTATSANHADTASAVDWSGVTSKPDPVVTVVLSGDVTGNANATLTDLGNASVSITTSIAANSVALGTDTTGDYVASLTASTGVSITGTTGEGAIPVIAIGQPVGTSDAVSFSSITTTGDIAVNGGDITTTSTGTATIFNSNATTLNIGGAATTLSIGSVSGTTTVNNSLVVNGDLTISGSVTTLNTETLTVEDNVVVLNSNVTGSPSTDAGVEIERGTSANVSILWNETDDLWTLTNNGSTYHQIARKSTHDILGNSSSVAFVLTHNLGTRDVSVNVYDSSSPYDTVEVDVERTGTSTITVRFASAPTDGTNYRAVIVG